MRKAFAVSVILVLCVLGLVFSSAAQEFVIPENLPILRTPIIATTCGQSPGALMVRLLCTEVGLYCENIDLLTADELAAECPIDSVTQSAGVLIVTTGTSLKGMGAAGVDINAEISRCVALIEKAKELGMIVIVAQIEGASRRVDEYDEASIQAMSPLADLLITRSDVNEDGYFTALAEENGIPQIFIENTLDLQVLLPLIFVVDEG